MKVDELIWKLEQLDKDAIVTLQVRDNVSDREYSVSALSVYLESYFDSNDNLKKNVNISGVHR